MRLDKNNGEDEDGVEYMEIGMESEGADVLALKVDTLFIDASCFFSKYLHVSC